MITKLFLILLLLFNTSVVFANDNDSSLNVLVGNKNSAYLLVSPSAVFHLQAESLSDKNKNLFDKVYPNFESTGKVDLLISSGSNDIPLIKLGYQDRFTTFDNPKPIDKFSWSLSGGFLGVGTISANKDSLTLGGSWVGLGGENGKLDFSVTNSKGWSPSAYKAELDYNLNVGNSIKN